jgi:microcystin-dependent protein
MKNTNINHTLKSLPCALIAAAALLALGPATAQAANGSPPERISYQGYLVDANGNQLGSTNTGPKNYDVIFRIYNDQTLGSLANRLWSEQQTVTVDKGYFSVMLGEGSTYLSDARPALSSLFTNAVDASDRYVEITVKGIGASGVDSTLLPRMRLLSSPYAYLAKYALSASTLVNAGFNVVSMTRTNVGINNASPASALDVNGTITGSGLNVQGAATVTGTATLGTVSASSLTAGNISASGTISGYGTIPLGGIIMWSGTTVPTGWAICDGSTVNNRATPDLRGRFVLGSGSGSGLTTRTLGYSGGEENHTLTVNEMPGHTHSVTDPGHTHAYWDPTSGSYKGLDHDDNGTAVEYPDVSNVGSSKTGITLGSKGGDNAHNNMPPYYVLAFIMRVN